MKMISLPSLNLHACTDIFLPGFAKLSTRSLQEDGSLTKHATKLPCGENCEYPVQFPNPALFTYSVHVHVKVWDPKTNVFECFSSIFRNA